MPERITIHVNGAPVQATSGMTVAAALMTCGHPCRVSVSGEGRGPLCGMGTCYECRVCIDGAAGQLACQTLCSAGMEIRTHE